MKSEYPYYAFPSIVSSNFQVNAGMTLRDYIAAKALMGMIASENDGNGMLPHAWAAGMFSDAADMAYKFAEAMLEARGEK